MPVHQSPRFQPADCRKGRCLVPVYFDDEAKKRADGGTASRVIRRPEDRGSEVRWRGSDRKGENDFGIHLEWTPAGSVRVDLDTVVALVVRKVDENATRNLSAGKFANSLASIKDRL